MCPVGKGMVLGRVRGRGEALPRGVPVPLFP